MNACRLLVSICLLALAACMQAPEKKAATPENVWFIFLETGKRTPDDKALVEQMQRGHIDNFKRLFGEKKLFAAGPLQDPSGHKRGIVVVKAPSKEELVAYFQADDYVKGGYMALNAVPSIAHQALATEGIDASGIEEVRIIQILRTSTNANGGNTRANRAFLQSLVDKGVVGAWYSMEAGPVAEVLFSRTTDTRMLEDAFAQYPASKSGGATVAVWRQWLSKGVVNNAARQTLLTCCFLE